MSQNEMTEWDEEVMRVIPSTFYMLSSSADHQHSEEAYNTSKFELPNPAGKAGGACTSAFLQQQYETGNEQSWVETLKSIKAVLHDMGYNQTPTLSCSRMFDVNSPMTIVPAGSGRRRALLIGINYVGQKGELTACHNDCLNIKEYLIEVHGFNESEMLILMDDGKHKMPTKDNIENAMCLLCHYSQPNDVVFVSFSGHGGNIADRSGDEDDGFDESLIPVDFMENGHILDDDIINILVKPMPANVTVTVLMDCCHSGTVMDLPYKISANDTEFKREEHFNMEIVTEPRRSGRGAAIMKSPNKKTKPSAKSKTNDDEVDKNDKKKKKKKPDKDEDLAPDAPVGPKRTPDGAPVLPVRYAAQPEPTTTTSTKKNDGESDDKDDNDDDDDEIKNNKSYDNDDKNKSDDDNDGDNDPTTSETKSKKKGIFKRLFGRKKESK